jgi:hypothetical protein
MEIPSRPLSNSGLNRNPLDDVPRHPLLPPVVRSSACPDRYCTSSSGIPCVNRSVITVTRNLCGDSRSGSPASFSRRLGISQYNARQVVTHRDLPALAAFFLKPQHVLRPVILEIAQAELGHCRFQPGNYGMANIPRFGQETVAYGRPATPSHESYPAPSNADRDHPLILHQVGGNAILQVSARPYQGVARAGWGHPW